MYVTGIFETWLPTAAITMAFSMLTTWLNVEQSHTPFIDLQKYSKILRYVPTNCEIISVQLLEPLNHAAILVVPPQQDMKSCLNYGGCKISKHV